MIYTNSSLLTYNTCPRKFKYDYVDLIDPTKLPMSYRHSDALMIGRDVHQMMAEEEIEDEDEDRVEIAKVMSRGLNYWQDKTNKKFKVEEAEIELGGTIEEFKVAGKLDGIVKYDDKMWILDYKTSSRILKDPDRYSLKQGFKLYELLAEANGYGVAGTLVAYLRRPSLYRRTDEDVLDYVDRVAQDIVDRTDSYYELVVIPKKERFQTAVRRDILNTVMHTELDESIGYYRLNPRACNEWSSPCKFRPLCLGTINPDECQKKDKMHEELKAELSFEHEI